jgi:Methylamine utilisation protein MauE
MELIGLYLVAVALLVAAGLAKAVRPGDTARAFGSTFHLPLGPTRGVIRVLATGEATLGVIALIWPEPVPAALVAASYLGFAAVLVMVRVNGGAIASCGCFGRPDTPVMMAHVIADVCLGAAAVAVAVAGHAGSMAGVLAAQPGSGVPLIATSLLAAWLTMLVMDQLSRLVAARRLAGITHSRRA